MKALELKVKAYKTEMLKKIAADLMKDFRDGADDVQRAVMNELCERLLEAEFVAFCDSL